MPTPQKTVLTDRGISGRSAIKCEVSWTLVNLGNYQIYWHAEKSGQKSDQIYWHTEKRSAVIGMPQNLVRYLTRFTGMPENLVITLTRFTGMPKNLVLSFCPEIH